MRQRSLRMRALAMGVALVLAGVAGMSVAGTAPVAAVDEKPYVVEDDWTNCWDQSYDWGCTDGACWQTLTFTCDQGTRVTTTQEYDGFCYIGVEDFDYCKQG